MTLTCFAVAVSAIALIVTFAFATVWCFYGWCYEPWHAGDPTHEAKAGAVLEGPCSIGRAAHRRYHL